MDTTVIELSRWTSSNKKSNSEWTNTLKSGITIEEGDTILVKNAFIDSTNLDPNILVFNDPINCHLEFAFYMTNVGFETVFLNPTVYPNIGGNPLPRFQLIENTLPDGLPYIYRIWENPNNSPDPVNDPVYISSFDFTIPAGNYTKAFLGEYISKQLQSIRMPENISGQPILNNASQTNYWSPNSPYNVLNTLFQDTYLYNEQSIDEGNYKPATGYVPYIGYPPVGQVFSYDDPFINNSWGYGSGRAFLSCYAYQFLKDLPNDTRYSCLENEIISSSNGSPYIFGQCNKININNVYIAVQDEPKDNGEFIDYNAGYIGSPSTSITYNQNSGLFEWDYLHNPIIDNNNNEVTVLQCIDLGNGRKQPILTEPTLDPPNINPLRFLNYGSRGGIMFTKLEPVSFWSGTLGFNLDNVLFDPTFTNVSYNEFEAKTTKNYSSISDLQIGTGNVKFGSYDLKSNTTIVPEIPTPDNPVIYVNQSTVTSPIIAENLPAGTKISGGHYLLDLKGYSTDYKYELGDTQIKGIVSSFFISPDAFVCSVGPDSASYQHKGQPIALNQIDISIIDPLTHRPVTNLNPNSSVYLQVIKAQKQQQQTEEKKQEKP